MIIVVLLNLWLILAESDILSDYADSLERTSGTDECLASESLAYG